MPSQPRTNLISFCILSCLTAAALYCATAVGAFAASAASADQSNYAGKMLDKITEIWAPPPALKSDFKVRLKVSVDSKGQVESCKPVKSSGLEAFDNSVCGAVRQIGSFGTPPYGAPIEINLTFWNGTPKGKPRPETLNSEEAMRAEVKARSKAEAALGDSRAEAAEDRARERAEAVATAGGKAVPEVRPAPVAPRTAPKPDDTSKKTAASRHQTSALGGNAPATQLMGKSSSVDTGSKGTSTKQPQSNQGGAGATHPKADSLPTYGEPDESLPQAPEPAPAAPTAPAVTSRPDGGATPQGQPVAPVSHTAADIAKYRRDASRQLRDNILIPAETEPGEYKTRLVLSVSPQGEIADFKVVTPTGDKLLDKYVQRGIRRAGSLPPPPAELGGTLDITLTLVRR